VHVARARAGNGAPVLLIHGFGADHASTWIASGWTTALERAGRTWLAPDLPGHGRSERSHAAIDYAPARIVKQLGDVIDAFDEVDVAGYSYGGRLAMGLAQDRPGRVGRLVVGGIGRRCPFTPAADEAITAYREAARAIGDPLLAATWSSAVSAADSDPDALAAFIRGAADASELPTELALPVLLFAGERDEVAAGLADIARSLADATMLELAGRDHRTTLSAQVVKRAAVEFLARE
jgi:pimeloyl-ACP methyl ester carboxylesterase